MPTNINRKPVIDTEPDIGVGIMLPLDNEQGGVFSLSYSTQEQAISNLKNLLFTNIGERLMQPTFGTTIQLYLQQPVQQIEIDRIRRAIETAIKFWLPYIILQDLYVETYTPNGINSGDFGALVYLLFKVSESGANIPMTLLYTSSTIRELTNGGARSAGRQFPATNTYSL